MENKGSLFFGISSVIIIFLFFLPDLFKQPEKGASLCALNHVCFIPHIFCANYLSYKRVMEKSEYSFPNR